MCVCVCVCVCNEYYSAIKKKEIMPFATICVYIMEYYSAIKKNKIMPFATTWMDLDIILLNEIRQTGKDKYHVISLICGI